MKHGIHILFWMLIAALSSCTDDEIIDVPEPQPQTGIVIRLSAGDLEQTRTDLTSQANLHHVQSVYAILYKENADKSDYDYVTCDDLNWSPKDSSSYGEAQAQAKVLDLPNDINLEAGNYTVLCVGLDDKSGDTYGLTPENMQSFKTLSKAKATLAGGKTKDDIAKSELFAGWNQFHFAPDSLNIVDVEMKRRVAGVLCYLTDVPYELTISGDNGGTYRVTKVQVCLYKNQHSEISLLRKEIEGKGYPADFGSKELANSNVLMEFPLEDYSKQQDKNLYAIPQQEGLAPNSLLGGVYMIPIDKDEQENTIEVKLLGKVITSSGEKPVEEAEEIEIANFPAINDDIDFEATEGSTKNYPIRPNLIYHIGDKPSDEEEGTPESLAGTEVKIGVKCWENETVDVEFPSVPITLKMQLVNSELAPYTMQDPDDLSKPYYIFDCIGSTDNFLKVERSVLYNYWKVIVQAVPGGNFSGQDKMIYFGQKYNSTTPYPYKDTFYGSGIDYIPIAMTDYAKYDGGTSRKMQIRLIAMNGPGENAAEVTGTEVTMTVEQYNAIIVLVKDDDNKTHGYRGFSHFNVGTIRNLETGAVEVDGSLYKWNYHGSGFTEEQIFGHQTSYTDGEDNYTSALAIVNSNNKMKEQFYGNGDDLQISALCAAGRKCISYLEDNIQQEGYWFLPASYELQAFLDWTLEDQNRINKEYVKVFDENDKEKVHNKYWTSDPSDRGYPLKSAYTYFLSQERNGIEVQYINDWKTDSYYVRQCCNVAIENKYQQ